MTLIVGLNFQPCKGFSLISKLLKRVMQKCDLKQKDLAEVLEVSLSRVKAMTSGRVKNFTREEIELLVGKLEIRAEWLITGQGPMLEDDETQDEFAARLHAENQARLMVNAMTVLSETTRLRLCAVVTGDPAHDGPLIDEAIRNEFCRQPGLKPDEAALLDNYRHSPKEAQDALKATSAALAQPKLTKGKVA